MGLTTSTNKVEEKSLSTKKKSSAEANYFSLEVIHSTKNMQFFIFFSFFALALTADGAKTKKQLKTRSIFSTRTLSWIISRRCLRQKRKLMRLKRKLNPSRPLWGTACAKLDKQDVGAHLTVELPMITTTLAVVGQPSPSQ